MLRNYFKILLRLMLKQKGFSVINISGLTIGIACSLLIMLYVMDELRFDRFHQDADRIFRVGFAGIIEGAQAESAQTGLPLAGAVERIDGVQSAIRLAAWKTFPVKYEDKTFTEKYLLLADPGFFRFFSFRLMEGNPDSVLRGKGKVVITESAARRYFNYRGSGDTSPIGKTLIFAQGTRVSVSGIAEDPPPDSHFHFSLVLSLSTWETIAPEDDDWITGRVFTYYKLLPDVNAASKGIQIKKELEKYLNLYLEKLRNTNLEALKKKGDDLHYFIQPLKDIHLRSNLQNEIEVNGSIARIFLFGSVALLIILLACINFMNLSTAQSSTRAKEIAIRKSAGAGNRTLIGQFLVESCFYVVVAMFLALCIVTVSLGPFNYFSGKQISLGWLLYPEFVAAIIVFTVFTALMAGSYPAFYLTRFNPVEVMKGNLRARLRTYGIRNVLVVFQFFISAALIIATLVVYHQLQFIQKVHLGFDKSNVVNLLHTLNLKEKGPAFKEALLAMPAIISASYCNRLPPNVEQQAVFRPVGSKKDYLLAVYEMDRDHLKTMGYKMLAGRFFDETAAYDSPSVIVNETAARKLGMLDFKGKKVISDYDVLSGMELEVIGIMQDFNFQSLKDPIQPMAIVLGKQPNWEMAIRLKQGDPDSAMAVIRKVWSQYAPDAAFEYSFVEQNFDAKQRTEKQIGLLFITFTFLAIVIACLGLFGLATFTAEHNRKQIGIRKALGASPGNIVLLLNQEFLKLVVLANLIAWPVGAWIMHEWLNEFAYHTGIAWWIFILTGGITFLIAFLSISYMAFKAAVANPVDSLHYE